MGISSRLLVFVAIFFFFSFPVFADNSVTFDPATGNYLIQYQSVDPAVGEVRLIFEPSRKTKPDLIPEVSFKEPSIFEYAYEIKNQKGALQSISFVKFISLPPVTAIKKPEGFSGSFQRPILGTVMWGTLKGRFDIKPGESKGGFGFASEGLPEVVNTKVRGRPVIDLRFPDEPPQEIADQLNQIQGKDENRYATAPTVAPGTLPGNLTVGQLLDRLVNLKHQALQLGWIDNTGVANSLNKKLETAKKKLEKGDTKTASNILHAFLHELQAQHEEEKEEREEKKEEKQVKKKWWEFWKKAKREDRKEMGGGKHINDNAFYLLKANVEFLLFKLGARSR